ncbi:hypothetical protein [Frateuria terrea]|uniref:Uncharacterized protein n=1 Tax=Frateuria terrea TaxID=529704 RepID=A0A1H7A4Y3_9GAMM|nr:hypothetical protein [Frateuria terrea]SEJ59976.1 hypothetical protein SAMN04487997_0306 [Frateuria terrea]SFP65789.1 hypothetical protein SAMN02927913_3078 [Frateuria terrea]
MKLPYFKLKDALGEVRDGFAFGDKSDKLSSVSKLIGKTAANVGMLAVELGVEAVKRAPEVAGKMAKDNLDSKEHLMTPEQVEKHREMILRGEEAERRRLEKEQAEREVDAG